MARRLVDGIEKTNRVFRTLSRESREKITDALNKGAAELVRDAQRLAVRSSPRAGAEHMAETIRSTGIRLRGDGQALQVFVIAGDTPETALAAYRTEFGRQAGPGDHPGHGAQEFLFPSYWRNRSRVRNRVKRAIAQAAKEAAARGR